MRRRASDRRVSTKTQPPMLPFERTGAGPGTPMAGRIRDFYPKRWQSGATWRRMWSQKGYQLSTLTARCRARAKPGPFRVPILHAGQPEAGSTGTVRPCRRLTNSAEQPAVDGS